MRHRKQNEAKYGVIWKIKRQYYFNAGLLSYHWACVEKQVRPETSIGKLNPEVVLERRRGLWWLISEEQDWNAVSLDT